MRKFYIPTSTLNFNNILSTESISPKAYYGKRGFGYSRWATIPENPFDNAIVLYDNLCYFDRPKSDIEDHPLLIEVELDESQLKQAGGYWYSDHTLYFTHRTTRFLFFNKKDKTITLSMSESSSETKLIRLYVHVGQIQIVQKPIECYNPVSPNEPCELNESEIEKDIRINKMKGLLYGYYIGSLLSSDLDSVKYLNAFKEIHNIFAAILSSFEKRPTAYQNERLELLCDYITEQNADFKSLCVIINSPALDTIGKAKKIMSLFPRGFLQNKDKNAWLSWLQYASEKDEKENQAIIWIKQKIDNAKRQMWSKKRLLNPGNSEIVVMDNNLYSLKNSNLIDEMDNRLCVSWINEILSDKNTHGRISTYKEELAKNLTLKAKEVYQNSWENCQTRVYLNDLRRHIAGEEFKHEWNNGLLSSIAAVLVAGDDWGKMLSFMQSKEMNDYKMAFAFYGVLNGFANLTRDFTDNLFGILDKNYVVSVYSEIYRQLMGEIPDIGKLHIKDVLAEKNQIEAIETKGPQEEETRNIIQDESSLHTWQEEIRRFAKEEAIKKDKKRLMSSLEKALVENGQNMDHFKFITMLDKYDGWTTPPGKGPNAAWRRMQKHFVPDYYALVGGNQRKSVHSTPRKNTEPSLFDFSQEDNMKGTNGLFFYEDDKAWSYIEKYVPEKDREELHNDLIWFQDQMRKPKANRYEYYQNLDERDNEVIINKFCHLKKEPKNGKDQAPYFTTSLREKIKEILNKIYCGK